MAMINSVLLVFIVFCFIETIQLGWIVNGSSLHCPQNERNALLDFKQGVIDQTNRLSSWVGQDCCKWEGVSCDNFTGHVAKLDLRNPFPLDRIFYFGPGHWSDKTYSEACLIAVGEVNPSLLQLKHLNYLDLSWNNFSGTTIPNFFGLFHELTYLNLSNALFSGIVPHHLGNLSALQSLDLSTDDGLPSTWLIATPSLQEIIITQPLTVDTLQWTSSLFSLRHLDMSGIDLSIIPPDSFQAISLFPSLLELRFSACSLETIPLFHSTTENLTSLTILDLSQNRIQGPIPSAIRNMTSLKVLDLSNNRIQGPIPSVIRSMTSLEVLQLSSNQFSSNSSILDDLKNLNKLEVLDLSQNKFTGKMTESRFLNFSSPSIGDNLLELVLSDNKLTGYLPNWLHQWKSSLKLLDLSKNSFEGGIPTSFGSLPSLKELRLQNNFLSSYFPTSLTKLSSLQILNLGFNFLSGQIPTSLGRMSALRELDLYSNQLSGDIPMSLGKLSNLERLILDSNQFNGSVPESLGQLSQLTSLELGDNEFHGVVSELHFARLSKLKVLALGENSLSIKIISGWVPLFQLESIFLASCGVGPQFPDWLRTQTGLQYLNMSNTGISDSIPNWFQNLTSLQKIDLSSNQIFGKVPNLTGNIKDLDLDLSSNIFEGPLPQLPSGIRGLDLSNNKINEPIPADIGYTLLNLRYLHLSNNSINGTIPNSLCEMLLLSSLDLSKNHLSGILPHCLGGLLNLVVIDLTSNNLSGTIQKSFCHLSGSLISLHLEKNNFHGELPSSLQNCTRLSILDISDNKFSGEIPTWIGQSLHSFRILKLSSNKYNGSLSPKLCHLNELQILDIAGNNLFGNIPRCFGNFSAMFFNQTHSSRFFYDSQYEDKVSQVIKGRVLEYTKTLLFLTNLDLSNNNFVSQIPEQLTNLSGLIGLNLSKNHLTGSIPKKIGHMRSLTSLDFSNNRLSGTIPQSISELTSLSHLNLSNNNLSGPIPMGNQLQTLIDASIYDGNSELCGPPLEKKCTKEKDRKIKGEDEGDGDEFITSWFFIGMGSGCVVGFWVFCFVLLFKKTWRYAYFRFVDDIHEWLFFTVAARKLRTKRN